MISTLFFLIVATIIAVVMIGFLSSILGFIVDFPLTRLAVSAFTAFGLWYLYANILTQKFGNLEALFLNNKFIIAFVIIGTGILYFVYEP